MRKTLLAFPMLFLLAAAAPATNPAPDVVRLTAADVAGRPAFCAVAEMAYCPEADALAPCAAGAFAEQAEGFAAAWAAQAPWVGEHLTADLARALSRWAKPQMAAYQAVPPANRFAFAPVAADAARHVVVYEATADTLPAHSPQVTRWLKVYVLYSSEAKAIVRVTVTIRGQVLE